MDDKQRKKSLLYSILDGSFYSMMLGFGQNFFTAFAILLGASSLQLGLLESLPRALGSFSQLITSRLLRLFGTRKRVVCLWAFLEALTYIPIALVFLFGEFKVWLLILFISLFFIFDMIAGPAWSSWMGDLVDERERGRYFGRRNKIGGIVAYVSLLIAGYTLQQHGQAVDGFLIIFAVALVARIVSFIFLLRQGEPAYDAREEEPPRLFEFIATARESNAGRFILFLGLMNFAVYIASPFFAAYMLHDLGFSWWTFTMVTGASMIVKYLSMPIWGKAADRYGTRRVLALSALIMPLVPLLWMFSTDLRWLIFAQVVSGFSWAGFELCSFTFLFDATTPKQRATFVAYSNAVNGVAFIVGGVTGGLLAKYNHLFGSPYLFVFLVSFFLRYAATALFIPSLKEVRQVEHISYRDLLFDVTMIAPTMGAVSNVVVITQRTVEKTFEPVVDVVMETGGAVVDTTVAMAEDAAKTTTTVIRKTRRTVRKTGNAVVKAVEEAGSAVVDATEETSKAVGDAVLEAMEETERTMKGTHRAIHHAVRKTGKAVAKPLIKAVKPRKR